MSTQVKPLGELAPDYVLLVAFPQENGAATSEAQANVSKLIGHLDKHGFYTQARPADADQLLVFVKISDPLLLKHLKGEGVKEYLYGVRGELDTDESLIQQLTVTAKLSAVHHLLTDPLHEGGAGITPGSPEWSFVTKISPVWDYDENKRLLKSFFKLNFTQDDVEKIRSIAGEKVALYFAFANFYFLALIGPAVIGIVSHFLFARYSLFYTVLNSIWAIVFLAAWRKKQAILSLKWKTAGSSKVEIRRTDFQGETLDTDPVTGESIPFFSPMKRTARQIAFLPIALGGIALLVSYQVSCFFIEIFLTEIYQGPGKAFLGLVPTILIVGVVPILTSIYEKFVDKALAFENHEYQSTYDRSKTQKMYLYNFLSSYVPLFITVFFYLPFGHIVNNFVPTISTYSSKYNIPVVHDKYQINNDRLVGQFGYFTLTAQIIGFLVENVVPLVIRLVKEKTGGSKSIAKYLDSPQETAYLNNVRQQLAMPEFDVDGEYRELVMQFGYLVLFGPVWSLAPLVSLIFNWIEIRGDAEKLLFECSRPVPRQAENNKPWDSHIRILTWIGSFTGPLVTVMYSRHSEVLASSSYSHFSSPIVTPGWKLATTAFIAENVALGFNFAVESLFQSSVSEAEKEHNKKELLLRRSYVEAYANDASNDKRSLEIDSTSNTWKNFSSDNVVKAAIGFPALLIAAKAANDKIKGSEKAADSKPTSQSVEAAAESVPSASTGYAQHSTDTQLRSTTASKTVPKTSEPVSTETREAVITDDAPAVNTANPFNAAPTGSAPSHAKEAVIGGGIAASLASAVGVKSFEVKNDNVSTVPSDKTGLDIPVSSTPDVSTEDTATPKKKRGFFGLGKKDAKSIGKAVKSDATKVAPQLKAVGADVAHGDFDSAKKAAKDFTKNPDEFVGNTKAALSNSSGSAAQTSKDATVDATGSTPSLPSSKDESTAVTGTLSSPPTTSESSTSRSKSLFRMGKSSKRDSKIVESPSVPSTEVPVTQTSAPSSSAIVGSIGAGAAATGLASEGTDDYKSTEGSSTAVSPPSTTEKTTSSGIGSIGTAAGLAATVGAGAAAIGLSKGASTAEPAPAATVSDSVGAKAAGVAATAVAGAAALGYASSKGKTEAVPTSSSVPSESVTAQSKSGSVPSESVPVPSTLESAEEHVASEAESTPSKSSRGFFGFHKSDMSSLAKAAKADATKLAPDAKKVAGDIKNGDWSSAKKLASDVKSNPNEYFGNTKSAIHEARGAEGNAAVSSPSTKSGVSAASTETSAPSSSGAAGATGALGGIAAAVGLGGYLGSQSATSQSTVPEQKAPVTPTGSETELKSSVPSESVIPSSSTTTQEPAIDSPSVSTPQGSASKPASSGIASGLGIGAVAGALGLGSNDKGASTPSSSSGSLAGATLPPDFEKKVSSKGYGKSGSPSAPGTPSGQQTGYTGSSAPAFGSQPDSAVYGSVPKVSTPQKQTLDPNAGTTETSGSSNLKAGALAGGVGATLAAAGSSLSNNLSSNGKSSQKSSSGLASEGSSANAFTEKAGKSFNDYVQLAADKVDEYAKKSDNQYVTQGNTYVQKLADGIEDYTQKNETGAAPTTPKQGSQFVKTETPEQKSTGTNGALPAQFLENTNPFNGDTGVVTNQGEVLGDDLAPPKITTDVNSATSSTASSPSKSKKRRGLLSKIKEKVTNSPSSTPKK